MKLNGTWTNFGEGESIYLRAVRLKQDSYNTSRTVHNQLSVGISPVFLDYQDDVRGDFKMIYGKMDLKFTAGS